MSSERQIKATTTNPGFKVLHYGCLLHGVSALLTRPTARPKINPVLNDEHDKLASAGANFRVPLGNM